MTCPTLSSPCSCRRRGRCPRPAPIRPRWPPPRRPRPRPARCAAGPACRPA
ncbi:hypothetical protein HMPREF0731_3627, partial [Pseudoroseomonas cervicalis ATCC 49957]